MNLTHRISLNAIALLCALALLAPPAARPARAETAPSKDAAPERVTLTTSDGVEIAGSFYAAEGPVRGGLLLLHMLGADRDSFSDTAGKLRKEGFSALAIDLRGHGESTKAKQGSINYMAFTSDDYAAMDRDVDAALAWLEERLEKGSPIGVLGASIGANLALRAATAHPEVVGVALLSPSLDYRGIVTESVLPKYGDRPLFVAVSEGDYYSADGAKKIAEDTSKKVMFRPFEGNAHGTRLFTKYPELEKEVLAWLKENIRRGSGPAKAQRPAAPASTGG